jgi:hypothetical protein
MSAAAPARERLRSWLVSGRAPVPVDDSDARTLADVAHEQRLVALLHAAIGDGWSDAIRAQLHDEHRRLLVTAVAQLDTMARVEALLSARGLRALPLKGAAVAESLYESPAQRPMGDVDVLALDDFAASVRAVEEAGFVGAERADHAWSFVDPLTRGLVELHRSVTSCPGLFPLDSAGLWSRARPASGQVRRLPSSADLLVQLAQHAVFQHGGVLSLGQWLDFRRLQERDPMDHAHVIEVAGRARATVCLRAALFASKAIVGGPEGMDLGGALPSAVRRWADSVRRDPLRAVTPSPPSLARLRWGVAAGHRWALVTGTLRSSSAEPGQSALVAGAAMARRAAGLAWRYARRPW